MNTSFLDFKLIQIAETEKILSQCKGRASKGIFICYPSNDNDQREFLAKILSAVGLDLNTEVQSLEKTPENDFSFSRLNRENKLSKVFLFGIHPKSIGLQIQIQKYQPFMLNNCLFLIGDDLTSISQNQASKKLLWAALKGIFEKET